MALKHYPRVVAFPRRARHARHPRWHAAFAALNARVAALEERLGAPGHLAPAAVRTRMRTSFIVSLLAHVLIIYGVTVKMPGRAFLDNLAPKLDVVLVNAKSKAAPAKPDALAQHNLDGGGNTDDKRQAQNPLPVMPDQKTEAEVKLALRRVEQLEREARQLMTQSQAKSSVATAPATPKATPNPAPEPEVNSPLQGAEILQRSLEIARLEAKIAKDWDSYQQRPRRRFIGARTQEYRMARYVEDWRQKIERVGEINYPQAARDQKLSGRVVVTVAVRANGSVEQVDIRPSGNKVLDEGARRIVQLAAPFSAFPPDIARDVDVLHITRTWTFTTGERFVSE